MSSMRRAAGLFIALGSMASALMGQPGLAWAVGQDLVVEEPEKKKIVSDAAVQSEMTTIRNLTLDVHTLVTHRRMPPAEARKYHGRITQAVAKIEAETTLRGAPRETLDAILQDIVAGAAAIAGADKSIDPIDGIVLIDDALKRYEELFEHPGWQPLR